MKLPVFEMIIDENETSDVEVSFVALVDKPAIEKNFLAFKDQKLNFAINEEKRIISGPAMVADTLIYRKDEQGEYNVFFSKDTISKIALKFFKKDYQKNLNLFHDPSLSLEGITIFESFISDKERGIQPMEGFNDLPDGSWFISAKVENDEVWAKIKSGEVKGFSVEGIFTYMKSPVSVENQIAEILSATYNGNSHIKESTIMSMVNDMLSKLKEKFIGEPAPAPAPAPAPGNMATEYTLKDGTAVSISEFAVGGVCMVGDAPLAAGKYDLADGSSFTVGDAGVITEVGTAAAPEAMTIDKVNELIMAAIKSYHEQMEAAKLAMEIQKGQLEKQDERIKGLFEIVEALAKTPQADPVETKASFSTQRAANRDERLRILSEQLSKLKKVS